MLEELTNDIHQSPNKQKVLMELANCIASGEQTYQRAVYNLQTVGLFRTDLICFHLHGDVSLVFPLFLFWASVTKVIGDICTQAIDEKISYPHIGHGSYNLEKVLNFSSRSY